MSYTNIDALKLNFRVKSILLRGQKSINLRTKVEQNSAHHIQSYLKTFFFFFKNKLLENLSYIIYKICNIKECSRSFSSKYLSPIIYTYLCVIVRVRVCKYISFIFTFLQFVYIFFHYLCILLC